ncbi:family 20 glycosylhydrolase [Roseiconus lacunae]|uniref:beta-N-acetylhexosaminidase n=1 Tax=Roseiconus lacunae TaxID=2605694 RepID=A0ABT7PG10_9BACT|nr:family 20 glycosylhydrolase [Roseiconus lacunae]MDM4015176.1 family 20 glycosylhydrolase [Roseiconus lacunae]
MSFEYTKTIHHLVGCVVMVAGYAASQFCAAAENVPHPIVVPTPQSFEMGNGFATLSEDSTIYFDARQGVPRVLEASLEPLANVLAEEIEITTGLRLTVKAINETTSREKHDIQLRFAPISGDFAATEADEDQSYSLEVNSKGIVIESQYYKGVAYGTATLLQLLDVSERQPAIPCLSVLDKAEASFRNILIDVARNPISIGVVKDVVRLARLYKVRYVQLHLTDDQSFTFPFAPVIEGLKSSGIENNAYTRNELLDLVAYADARGVTLIPEIEVPGHSTKIMQSGYLRPLDQGHAAIADPANFAKINTLIDDVLSVFKSSPYFHMGGDESGAGKKLIPLVASINQHVRGNPTGGKRRLLVWEGFHGAPTDQIPATGEDRVIVMAWESSYNTPWDLLRNGYQLINASWKPTYLVGGYGSLMHAGSGGVGKFSLQDLYRWNRSTFMHWEPRRPIYEDVGPNDPVQGDHLWDASWIDKEDQIIGGMLLYWEQREGSTIHYLLPRVPVFAQRLWNPDASFSYDDFASQATQSQIKTLPIVQPVEILPAADRSSPVSVLFRHYSGESATVTLRNRTQINGKIRYSKGNFTGWKESPKFDPVPSPTTNYEEPVAIPGEFGIRAELLREDNTPVEGHSWAFFANWPMKVSVTDFDLDDKVFDLVPDMTKLPKDKILRQYSMPYIRGPLNHKSVIGQMLVCDFVAPVSGEYVFELKTQSGRATLYLDQNQNHRWEQSEALIQNSPNTEIGKTGSVELKASRRYQLRIDHATGMPRPVLSLSATIPGTDDRRSVLPYIELPKRSNAPENDTQANQIEAKGVNFRKLAFYPDRWTASKVDFEMLAWEGQRVVLVTRKGDYDASELARFVERLDRAWEVYSDLIGTEPRQFKTFNGKPTICALPKPNLSCGLGCGYVGASGIEVAAFYSVDLPNFQKHPDCFQHYYFYEMGRNYFVFGDRHSLFTTGFAVFMRYVCMDELGCDDLDVRTRETIEACEEVYAKSNVGFYDAFTNLGAGEKSNRLKDSQGNTIHPSDQPVMYATAMLKLRRDFGDQWVTKFFHLMRKCDPAKATNIATSKTQVFNWLVCASAAAEKDLTFVFADRWRLPMSQRQRQLMKQVDWSTAENDLPAIVSKLVADK